MTCNLSGSSVHGDVPDKNTGVGCHALLQGIPNSGIEPGSPALQVDFLLSELPGKPIYIYIYMKKDENKIKSLFLLRVFLSLPVMVFLNLLFNAMLSQAWEQLVGWVQTIMVFWGSTMSLGAQVYLAHWLLGMPSPILPPPTTANWDILIPMGQLLQSTPDVSPQEYCSSHTGMAWQLVGGWGGNPACSSTLSCWVVYWRYPGTAIPGKGKLGGVQISSIWGRRWPRTQSEEVRGWWEGQTVHEPRLQASGIWLCYLHQIMIIKHKFKDKITKSFKIKTTEFEIPSAGIWVWGPRPQEASGAHTRDWKTAASQIFLNEAVCHGGN